MKSIVALLLMVSGLFGQGLIFYGTNHNLWSDGYLTLRGVDQEFQHTDLFNGALSVSPGSVFAFEMNPAWGQMGFVEFSWGIEGQGSEGWVTYLGTSTLLPSRSALMDFSQVGEGGFSVADWTQFYVVPEPSTNAFFFTGGGVAVDCTPIAPETVGGFFNSALFFVILALGALLIIAWILRAVQPGAVENRRNWGRRRWGKA